MSEFTITLIIVGAITFFVFLCFIIRLLKNNNSIYKLEKKYKELTTMYLDLKEEVISLHSQFGYYDDEEEEI